MNQQSPQEDLWRSVFQKRSVQMGLPIAFEKEKGEKCQTSFDSVLSSSPSYAGIFPFPYAFENIHLQTELKPLGMVESSGALSSNT